MKDREAVADVPFDCDCCNAAKTSRPIVFEVSIQHRCRSEEHLCRLAGNPCSTRTLELDSDIVVYTFQYETEMLANAAFDRLTDRLNRSV